jgi:phosphoribosylglycinamide formyltransferase-1
MEEFKIGWFSTGRDQAAIDLLKTVQEAIRRGEIDAEIKFVFSNRGIGESKITDQFLVFANHDEGLPLEAFSFKKFRPDLKAENLEKWRREYDLEAIRRLKMFLPVDLIVLTGYMLIISKGMCQRYKMINLHPATPGGPKGTWREVILQLIESRERESGVMMHLVTPQLDAGPPVTYCTFSIRDDLNERLWIGTEENYKGYLETLFWDIRDRGLRREFPLIIATLKAFSDGKVRIKEGKIVNAEGQVLTGGYNLTEEIDAAIKKGLKGGRDEYSNNTYAKTYD